MPVSTKLVLVRTNDLNFSLLENVPDVLGLSDGRGVVGGTTATDFGLEFFTNQGAPALDAPLGLNVDDISIAQLTGGNLVVAFTDPVVSSVRYAVRDATNGSLEFPTAQVSGSDFFAPDVAALNIGGFAIVSQRHFSPTDSDIFLHLFDASGTSTGPLIAVSGSALNELAPQIAVLGNGNIAVAWHTEASIPGQTTVSVAVYDESGTEVMGPTIIDSIGSTNRNVAITATDAGFAIVYEDNGWNLSTPATDLTLQTFDSAGTAAGEFRLTDTTGRETVPSVTRLDGNMLALGWTVGPATDTNALIGIFDLNTNTLGPRVQLTGGADPTDIAADVSVDHFTGQFFAAAYANATEGSVNGEAFGLGRVFTSTGGSNTMLATFMADRFLSTKSANDTVSYDDAGTGIAVSLLKNTVGQGGALLDTFVGVENLTGSDFADRITGSNLANVLRGGAGSDVLKGLKGNDVLDGGTGGDTLSGSKGRDTFVFNDGGDLITDFNFRKDSLDIDDALWTGTRSENQVVNRFADVVGNHVVLDFGNGDVLTIEGLRTLDQLRSVLDIV